MWLAPWQSSLNPIPSATASTAPRAKKCYKRKASAAQHSIRSFADARRQTFKEWFNMKLPQRTDSCAKMWGRNVNLNFFYRTWQMLRAAQSNSLEKQLIKYHQQHSIAASIASIYQDEMTKSNAHEIEWFYVLQRSLEMELDYYAIWRRRSVDLSLLPSEQQLRSISCPTDCNFALLLLPEF